MDYNWQNIRILLVEGLDEAELRGIFRESDFRTLRNQISSQASGGYDCRQID